MSAKHHLVTQVRQWVVTAALVGAMCVPVCAQALSSDQIFAELINRNQTRAGGLLEYTSDRGLPRVRPWRENPCADRRPHGV
jgi:hypothetical protein